MVSGQEQIAQEEIREAMDAGEFDQPAGRGKPLRIEENPFEAEGWRSTLYMLKHDGFTLPWIEEGMEIERKRLLAHRLLRSAHLADAQDRREADELFTNQIEALNREILQYNLRVPGIVFQRGSLDLEKERAAALIDLLDPSAAASQLQE